MVDFLVKLLVIHFDSLSYNGADSRLLGTRRDKGANEIFFSTILIVEVVLSDV